MRKTLIAGFCATALAMSGCASTADMFDSMAGIGTISEKTATFDGSTILTLSPTFLTDNEGDIALNQYKLGARWTSSAPDYVALVMNYDSQVGGNAYTTFDGLSIRIHDETLRFDTDDPTHLSSSSYNSVTNTIYTESESTVLVPRSLIEEMVKAEDVRIRIHSSDGYEDALFNLERSSAGQGLAVVYFRKFLVRINQVGE